MSDTLKLLLDRFDGRLTIRINEAGSMLGMGAQSAHNSASLGHFPVPIIRQKGVRPFVKTIDLANYLDNSKPSYTTRRAENNAKRAGL
jgi:hypothetical protein